MLAGFTFYHDWMIAGYALIFAAAHGLLALGVLRYAGAHMARWPLRAGAGVLVLGVAVIVFGNLQRERLTTALAQNIGKELEDVCLQAGKLISDAGGDASPDDEALRTRIQQTVRRYFSGAADERFGDARFAPVAVLEAGADEKWGDLVIALYDRSKGRDPVHMGCYNQYEHRYSGLTASTKPYWRWVADPIPFENIVFFRQDQNARPVVSFESAQAGQN